MSATLDPESLRLMRKFIDVREALDNGPEADLRARLMAVEDSFNVFEENTIAVLELASKLKDPEAVSGFFDNELALTKISRQCVLLLHNFLASVSSLRDHTHAVRSHLHKGKEFVEEWNEKAASVFNSSDVNSFVSDLRNYVQHYSLPIPGITLRRSADEAPSSALTLHKPSLLKWSQWHARSLDYINAPRDIEVGSFVGEYAELVRAFHSWRRKEQSERHQEVRLRYEEMCRTERELMRSLQFDERFAHKATWPGVN